MAPVVRPATAWQADLEAAAVRPAPHRAPGQAHQRGAPVGAGAGSDPRGRALFIRASAATARSFVQDGLAPAMKKYRTAPNRIQLENKDPRAAVLDLMRREPSRELRGFAGS